MIYNQIVNFILNNLISIINLFIQMTFYNVCIDPKNLNFI
jgi:hypothetical protein